MTNDISQELFQKITCSKFPNVNPPFDRSLLFLWGLLDDIEDRIQKDIEEYINAT